MVWKVWCSFLVLLRGFLFGVEILNLEVVLVFLWVLKISIYLGLNFLVGFVF